MKNNYEKIIHYNIDDISIKIVVDFLENLPIFCKGIRYINNLTQEEMSDIMGISRSTFSLMERDDSVSLKTIKKLLSLYFEYSGNTATKKKIKLNDINNSKTAAASLIIDAFNEGVKYANSPLPQTFDYPAERYYNSL